MFRHYLRLAKASLLKNKYYTLVNVFGLVCGMLSALIIAKYIGGSLQYDVFHQNKDNTYVLVQEEKINDNPQQKTDATYWGVGELSRQFPEVQHVTRFGFHVASLVVSINENGKVISNIDDRIFFADSSFLKIFTFPAIHGNPTTALSRNNSVVLTNQTSKLYFGTSNPVGKILTIRAPWGEETTYEVTAVIEDIPQKSRFSFGILINQSQPSEADYWTIPDYTTFIQVRVNTQASELAVKLKDLVNAVPNLKATKRSENIILESIGNPPLSNAEYLLLAVGIFIAFISWVNYINQVIAQSYWRIKEVSILRVTGSSIMSLNIQFVIESTIISTVSFFLIVVLYILIEPFMQAFTNGHLLPLRGDPTIVNFLFLSIFAFGLILASVIPAMIVLPQNFGAVLRNSSWSKIGTIGLRKGLVIVQFSISTILIICIFVINKQLDFMQNEDKGINIKDIVVVKAAILPNAALAKRQNSMELFKNRCAELPFVVSVASSTTVPGEEYRQETYISVPGQSENFLVHQIGIDEFYLELYQAKLIAGRNFTPNARAENRTSVILNESAARSLGIYDYVKALHKSIIDHESGAEYDLIGVVQDFHQTSLKYSVRPIAFKFDDSRGNVSIKMKDEWDPTYEELKAINDIWNSIYHESSFVSYFLQEKFNIQDRQDHYFTTLFKYFTVLSIIISCLGLFGLSLLLVAKRQKEVGIRKVFGASSINVLSVFFRSYIWPLSISLLIGTPIAYFTMNIWLSNYAYRIEMDLGIFLIGIVTLTTIFFLTVAFNTFRASMANPTNVLRN